MRTRLSLVLIAFALPVLASSPAYAHGRAICTASALTTALAAARSGDTVQIGACTIDGNFTVPAGVQLEGLNPATSRIRASSGVALTVTPGARETTLTRLRVESRGQAAVVARGAGAAALRDVRIDATLGVGVAAEGLTRFVLNGVRLDGGVTAALAAGVDPEDVTPAEIATHGIVVNDSTVVLRDVESAHFAVFGALLVDSSAQLDDVRLVQNVTTGLSIYGGTARLGNVTARGTMQPGLDTDLPVGIAFGGGAEIHSRNTIALNNAGVGVFHDSTAVVEHDNLTAALNDGAGVHAQRSAYVQLDNSTLRGNREAGFSAIDTTVVSVLDTNVLNTRIGAGGLADGIHLVRTVGDFRRITLITNDRAGLVADLAPAQSATDLRFANVSVLGGRGTYGVVAQKGGLPLPLLTTGISRFGASLASDAAFAAGVGVLGIAGYTNPCFIFGSAAIQVGGVGAVLEINE